MQFLSLGNYDSHLKQILIDISLPRELILLIRHFSAWEIDLEFERFPDLRLTFRYIPPGETIVPEVWTIPPKNGKDYFVEDASKSKPDPRLLESKKDSSRSSGGSLISGKKKGPRHVSTMTRNTACSTAQFEDSKRKFKQESNWTCSTSSEEIIKVALPASTRYSSSSDDRKINQGWRCSTSSSSSASVGNSGWRFCDGSQIEDAKVDLNIVGTVSGPPSIANPQHVSRVEEPGLYMAIHPLTWEQVIPWLNQCTTNDYDRDRIFPEDGFMCIRSGGIQRKFRCKRGTAFFEPNMVPNLTIKPEYVKLRFFQKL